MNRVTSSVVIAAKIRPKRLFGGRQRTESSPCSFKTANKDANKGGARILAIQLALVKRGKSRTENDLPSKKTTKQTKQNK